MNRVDRLNAILIHLQSKKLVKAQELANRFDISLRTVYRDVHALMESGVPVIGEAGSGYSIMDGYRLPPVMFTREEATAFLMAEKVLERYSDEYNAAVFREAMFKVKAVLRTAEKEFLSSIENNIAVLKTPNAGNEDQAPLHKILASINSRKALQITYESAYATETTRRMVEPVGIFLQNGNWYLIAFCLVRNDYRNFKVSRIRQQLLTDQPFAQQHKPIETFLQETAREKSLVKVILLVQKEVAKYIITEKYYHGFVSETLINGHVEMTFLCASLTGMARWVMMFGDHCKSIEPAELRRELLLMTDAIKKNFETVKSC